MMFSRQPEHFSPSRPVVSTDLSTADQRIILGVIIAAVVYQALLCLLNTLGIRTSAAFVGASEALIIMACVPLLVRRLSKGAIIFALFAGVHLCLASIISGQLNIKALRDLIIPLCFLWLGWNLGRPEFVDRILKYIIVIVLVMGFFELLLLDTYTQFFDIFSYYISTGNLQPITEYERESKLQLNGIRPEGIGRTLLPALLGSHRVSSVFLEPVSLGNFATMIAAWGLSRDSHEWRNSVFFVVSAIVLMVLSDSRFALLLVPLMLAMRLLLRGAGYYIALLAPFVAILMLLIVGVFITDKIGDTFLGRLAISGWALLEFDVATLFGVAPPANFGDMGYAYALSRFSLPMCLALWFCFWLLPMPDERGIRFRAFVALYIALILSVSGTSLFAFKTAALLWFMTGNLLRAPAPSPVPLQLHNMVNQTNISSIKVAGHVH